MAEEQNEIEYTSLRVLKTTRDKLMDMGKKSESYDDIIWRLVNAFENQGE